MVDFEKNNSKQNIEELLESGKTINIPINGYSMYPLLEPGRDRVIVAPYKGKLKRGDVALFRRRGEKLILHRVYSAKDGKYAFVGDNESKVESPIYEDQIRGVMVAFKRKGHEYSAKNPFFVASARVWMFLLPLRPFISGCIHRVKVIFGRKKG